VRVVGYVREIADATVSEIAYAQNEAIRLWANKHGHHVVAVCQDVRTAGHELGRDGLRALLGIIETGEPDAVVVASLSVFAGDKIAQEILIWDLRKRGVAVISASEDDAAALQEPSGEELRKVVRLVLAGVETHQRMIAGREGTIAALPEPAPRYPLEASDNMIIELISPPTEARGPRKITPGGP
jgi:DNA invertase Pin-like site-specific DNA recombinase